jgi:hypothetical protein
LGFVASCEAGPRGAGPKGEEAWHSFTAPLPQSVDVAPEVQVGSAACASPVRCLAIGGYLDAERQWHGLLLVKEGSSWKPLEAPAPSDASTSSDLGGVSLYAVACSPSSTCTAVGEYPTSNGLYGVIVTQTGRTWTAIRAPLPVESGYYNPRAVLYTIACPGRSNCIIGGEYSDAADNRRFALLVGSGVSWIPIEMPVPAGASYAGERAVARLSCSLTTCHGAGEYTLPLPSYHRNGLLLTGFGSSWGVLAAPSTAVSSGPNLDAQFTAISCPAPTSCVIGGDYLDATRLQKGMLLTRTRGAWGRIKLPPPSLYLVNGEIDNIACESLSFCVATYSYMDIRYAGTLAYQSALFAGAASQSSWRLIVIPVPRQALKSSLHIGHIACVVSAGCVAIGQYKDLSGTWHVLLLSSSGSRWHSTAIMLPGRSRDPAFSDITCLSSRMCVAVGTYTDSSGNPRGLIAEGSI